MGKLCFLPQRAEKCSQINKDVCNKDRSWSEGLWPNREQFEHQKNGNARLKHTGCKKGPTDHGYRLGCVREAALKEGCQLISVEGMIQ